MPQASYLLMFFDKLSKGFKQTFNVLFDIKILNLLPRWINNYRVLVYLAPLSVGDQMRQLKDTNVFK